jgi:hypothetical protein
MKHWGKLHEEALEEIKEVGPEQHQASIKSMTAVLVDGT